MLKQICASVLCASRLALSMFIFATEALSPQNRARFDENPRASKSYPFAPDTLCVLAGNGVDASLRQRAWAPCTCAPETGCVLAASGLPARKVRFCYATVKSFARAPGMVYLITKDGVHAHGLCTCARWVICVGTRHGVCAC